MYAMSERSDLPRFFSRVSPTGVPALSIGITAAIIAILVMIGSIPVIARTATFAILLYYTLANLAALRMKEGKGLFPDWISWAGLIACLVMALTMDWSVIASGLGILLAGFLLRFVVQKAGK